MRVALFDIRSCRLCFLLESDLGAEFLYLVFDLRHSDNLIEGNVASLTAGALGAQVFYLGNIACGYFLYLPVFFICVFCVIYDRALLELLGEPAVTEVLTPSVIIADIGHFLQDIFTEFEALFFEASSEYFGEFVCRIVFKVEGVADAGFDTRVGFKKLFHLFIVTCEDHYEFIAVVFHRLDECGDHFLTELVVFA